MSKINSIEWHKENYCNAKKYEERITKELENLHSHLSNVRLSNIHMKEQIDKAVEMGKESFDSGRFMKVKK